GLAFDLSHPSDYGPQSALCRPRLHGADQRYGCGGKRRDPVLPVRPPTATEVLLRTSLERRRPDDVGQYRHAAQCCRGLWATPAAAHAALPGDGGPDLPASGRGHCKGAGTSPVIAGLDPGVTMEWVADRRAKSTGTRSSLWLEHDLFPKARCPPGSSPGQAFSGSCLRACSRSYGIGTWSDACPYWKTGSHFSGTCARTTTGNPLDQSGRAPENLTTLAHFSVSSTMNIPSSAGEPRNIVVPRSASRACILVSVRTASTSLLRRPMISAGVLLRKPMA